MPAFEPLTFDAPLDLARCLPGTAEVARVPPSRPQRFRWSDVDWLAADLAEERLRAERFTLDGPRLAASRFHDFLDSIRSSVRWKRGRAESLRCSIAASPELAHEVRFQCGMGMYRGAIVVR